MFHVIYRRPIASATHQAIVGAAAAAKMPASKTVSTSAAETELGTHVFHVVGYSQQKAIGAHKDKSIVSGHFSVGGHDWEMLLMADILLAAREWEPRNWNWGRQQAEDSVEQRMST